MDLVTNPARRALCLGVIAAAVLPRASVASPLVQTDSRPLMGTRIDITLAHPDRALRQAALAAAWTEMRRLTEMMSAHDPGSALSVLWAASGREPVSVSRELMAVLIGARRMAARSCGLFDPTVGAYSGWRFGTGTDEVPEPATLARQRASVDYRALVLDQRACTVRLARPGMRLDLGGCAKLPILKAGLDRLGEAGVRDAMINGGGDVLCSGGLLGRPWRVGVRDPRAPARLVGVLHVGDGVVASSGDYERAFEHNGRHFHHILDPRTGMPSSGLRGVVLVSREVDAINGWGPAMMVAGPGQAREWLSQLGGVDALLAGPRAGPRGVGDLWMSPGMRARLIPG